MRLWLLVFGFWSLAVGLSLLAFVLCAWSLVLLDLLEI